MYNMYNEMEIIMIVFTSKNIYDSGISGKEFDKLKVSSFLDKFSNKQKLYNLQVLEILIML